MIQEPKPNILVSFSGGETSAYMINWLLINRPDHTFRFIFANTGEENEETLLFVKQCQEYFNIDVVWVEYKRLTYKEVNYETAYRSHDPKEIENKWQNHPFRHYISEFGIPNVQNSNCTREMKEFPITRYMSANGWKPSKYTTAIGIRADEMNRVGKLYYPLIMKGVTKPMINAFWEAMPFRLQLKGYEGNCKTCWKKSLRKHVTLAREQPHSFDFFRQMELEFSGYVKQSRFEASMRNGTVYNFPFRFFRDDMTVDQLFEIAKDESIENAEDDSVPTDYKVTELQDGTELDIASGCSESCEVFTGMGSEYLEVVSLRTKEVKKRLDITSVPPELQEELKRDTRKLIKGKKLYVRVKSYTQEQYEID